MPYDAEGNFIYPVPARKGGKRAGSGQKPVVGGQKNTVSPNDGGQGSGVGGQGLETSSPRPIPDPEEFKTQNSKLKTIPPPPIPDPEKLSPQSSVLSPATTSEELSPQSSVLSPEFPPSPTLYTVNEGGQRWQMSELDLAQLWNAQTWPDGFKLTTVTGQAIEVVYRGRWSGGFGPDFKGAIVRVGPELLKGDIELHLRTADWRLHGHHQDPRYNNVILQVVLEDSRGDNLTQDHKSIPTLALLPLFQKVGRKLADSLTIARESGTRLGSLSESEGPCCDRVAERTTDLEALLARIDQLGTLRFEERAARFEAACAADPDASEAGAVQELWAGLLEALGYSQNKAPFRKLAEVLPLAQVVMLEREGRQKGENREERVITLEATFLGTAGLLPSQRRLKPRSEPPATLFGPDEPLDDFIAGRYIEELERRWGWLNRHLAATSPVEWQPLHEREWTFARLRPPNHPARRIAGLARLLVRLKLDEAEDWLTTLTAKLNMLPAEACKELLGICRVELNGEESDSAAFWARRYDFSDRAIMAGDTAKGATADLIGADRGADMVVNIILPFLAGYGRDRYHPGLTQKALAVYNAHPRLGTNELVENVARQVFRYWLENPAEAVPFLEKSKGRAGKLSLNSLIDGARRQQGLIYLHHHFCAEQDYTTCPLG